MISSPTVKYAMAYATMGLTPDCGVSYLLPRVIGPRRALAMTLDRRTLTAQTALERELVTSIAERPAAVARDLAISLAHGPSAALGQAQRLIRASYDLPRATHARDEAETIATSIATPEARDLIRAITQQ